MIEIAAVLSIAAVLAYMARSRSRMRIVVLCPLRGDRVPEEIAERLGKGVPTEKLPKADFTIGYMPGRPGISVGEIQDAPTLERMLGPLLRRPVTMMKKGSWFRYARDRKWDAVALFSLALEVLHTRQPDSLLIDFRPPDKKTAQQFRIARANPDVDLAMYAYEILSRVRRYSRYRGAELSMVFSGKNGLVRFLTNA